MNGLYERAATCMIDRTNTAVSASAPASVIGVSVRSGSRGAKGHGSQGIDPITPAAIASITSFDRNQPTESGAANAGLKPAIAFKNASAPGRVSARKNTQPTITTARV